MNPNVFLHPSQSMLSKAYLLNKIRESVYKWSEENCSYIYRKVIEEYKNKKEKQQFRKILNKLIKQCNDADYNEDIIINNKFYQRAIEDAKNILEQGGIKL